MPYPWYLDLIIPVGFFILFFMTCCLEKQHIKQYIACEDAKLSSASPYCHAVVQQAGSLGFQNLGTFAQDRKSKIYTAVMGYWLSPDGKTLARIAGGKTAKINIRRTTLISYDANGRRLETADDFAGVDLTGIVNREVLMRAHLPELYGRHQERLAVLAFDARLFPHGDILAFNENMEMVRYSQLKQMGLARPVNREESIWNYTVRGAWLNYFQGFRKQLEAAKLQRERVKMKRPGDA